LDVEAKDPNLERLGPGYQRGDASICGLALGTVDGRRWYFPTGHEGGGNLDPDMTRAWARSELNAYTGEVVGAKLRAMMPFLNPIVAPGLNESAATAKK